jgi:serine/threonine-protein kinase
MPIQPDELRTGGAILGAVASSLLQQRQQAMLLQAGDQVGIYRVLRELGRGGMAVVYLAERADGEYTQQVALKWMQGGRLDTEAEALFRRERQALADLRHPHIARLLDGGHTEDGRPWFAMELIEGAPLDRHCVQASLPLAQRLALFQQVCAAVAFAHARGVLHRDIKPSNVLVDADGSAKLLDFGIAHLIGEEAGPATLAHTPGFASPEQLRGEVPTVASDVYQLGRLLAALLCGDERERATLAASAVVTSTPVSSACEAPASALPLRLPTDLAAILGRAGAATIEHRYPTVSALAADVDAFLAGRVVTARRPTVAYVAARFVRRHPVAVAATALGLALAIAAGVWFTWRLQAERDAADYQARVAGSVLDFLREDLLAAADPGAVPGREMSVREALDRASDSAAARFAGQPVEEGAIRTTLAGLYLQLGRLAEAEVEARRAESLAAHPQADSAQRLSARAALIDVLVARDQLDEAERLARGLALSSAAALGASAEATLWADLNLALIERRRGHFETAEQAYAELTARAAAAHGDRHALVRMARRDRAEALQMLGRHAEALPLAESVHAEFVIELGKQHPQTLQLASQIGTLYRHAGDFEAAMRWLEPTLQARVQVLGQQHPETLLTRNELATVLQELKRFDEAETLFREVLDARLVALGEAHQFTRNSMSNLGLLYTLWGKLDLAAPLYERTLAIELAQIGDRHPDTLALMHNIAGLYRRQQRMADAMAMHDRAVQGAEASEHLGPAAWQTALFRAGRASTLQASGQLAAAETEFSRARDILAATLGPTHARTLRATELLEAVRQQRAEAGSG